MRLICHYLQLRLTATRITYPKLDFLVGHRLTNKDRSLSFTLQKQEMKVPKSTLQIKMIFL